MCWPFRLQIDAISRLSSFVMDKQESDGVQKAHTDSHGRNDDLIRRNEDLLKRNDDLVKKIEDSGKIVTKLHENLERYLIHINFLFIVIYFPTSCAPSTRNSNSSIYSEVSICILQNQYDPCNILSVKLNLND
jgi:hypothetical protein